MKPSTLLLAAALCIGGAARADAAEPPGPGRDETVRRAIELIHDGDLAMAALQLRALPDEPEATAVARRLRQVIEARQRLARQLLEQAQGDAARGELGTAARRLETARAVDAGTAESATAAAIRDALERLDQALAQVEQCRRKRMAACISKALAAVREIDRHNGWALEAELKAHDWYSARSARTAPPAADAPTSTR